ncbi:MAG TPA: SRPBCC domain-containing protein, partial [Candidatus Binatia bacterium]|nr:SRPBCC domain-containing protein [Candidatus Binatia bacterium]
LAIERPHRLVFTWAVAPEDDDPSRVTVEVAPDGDGCVLTLTHEMPARWADYASRTEAGWTTMLGSLQRTLDSGDFAVVVAPDAVRFERLLPAPVDRVWTFLTDSEARGTWFASGDMELRVGGRVTLHFRHANLSSPTETPPERFADMAVNGHTMLGRVTRCEPPTLLSYTWGDDECSEVTFELAPHAEGTRLVLTHRRLATRDEMVDVAGGWHTHLHILVDRLAGRTPRGIWTLLASLDGVYERRLARN